MGMMYMSWGTAGAKGMVVRGWLWEHVIRQVDFNLLGFLASSKIICTWCAYMGDPKQEGAL